MTDCAVKNLKALIEVPVFLLFFTFMFANSVTTNFIVYRTCYVIMDFNQTDCAKLGTNYSDNSTAELEKKVQPHATTIMIALQVLGALIPPFLCFFLGPWTDKYGRKPLLLSTMGGCLLAYVCIIVISAIPNASPWFLLLFLIPSCMFGGVSAFLTAVICYITDVTSEEYRGVRMGIFEAVVALGSLLGTSTSSFALNAWGYVTVYSICASCVVLAWLYTYFAIPESVAHVEKEGKFRNLFRFSLMQESVRATFKRREYYNRGLLLTISSVLIIAVFTTDGDSGVIFLYLRQRFHWTLRKFTLYSSITSVTGIVGGITGIYLLHRVFCIREAVVILAGFLSVLTGSLFQGLATKSWQIYAAGGSKCLSGATSPMARSLLSKIVPPEDSGKVFSMVTALEIVAALLGSSVYMYIYNSTLETFPAGFNFVTVGLCVFIIILVVAILLMQKYQAQMSYQHFDDETVSVQS